MFLGGSVKRNQNQPVGEFETVYIKHELDLHTSLCDWKLPIRPGAQGLSNHLLHPSLSSVQVSPFLL